MAMLPARPILLESANYNWVIYLVTVLSSMLVAMVFPVGYVIESLFFSTMTLGNLLLAGLALGAVASVAALQQNRLF